MITVDSLPDDAATLKALVLAGQTALTEATTAQLATEARACNLNAEVRARTLLIEQIERDHEVHCKARKKQSGINVSQSKSGKKLYEFTRIEPLRQHSRVICRIRQKRQP